MRKSTALGLTALVLGSVAVRLSPLWSFLYWGSDTGEYFAILRDLVRTGHVSTTYDGWGVTYPYFPGMFFLQGGLAHLSGLDLPTVLNVLVPILGALSVVPIFLIARRVTGEDRVALFAAAVLAGAIPHAYTPAHPAPATVANLRALTRLLLLLRLRADRAAWLPLPGRVGARFPRGDHLCADPNRMAVPAQVSGASLSWNGICLRSRSHPHPRDRVGPLRRSRDDVSSLSGGPPLFRPARAPHFVLRAGPQVPRLRQGWIAGERLAGRPPRICDRGDCRRATRPHSLSTHGVPRRTVRHSLGCRLCSPLGFGSSPRTIPSRRKHGHRPGLRGERVHRRPTALHPGRLAGGDDPRGPGSRVLGSGSCERPRRVGPSRLYDGLRVRRTERDVGSNAGSVLARLPDRPVRGPLEDRLTVRSKGRRVRLD